MVTSRAKQFAKGVSGIFKEDNDASDYVYQAGNVLKGAGGMVGLPDYFVNTASNAINLGLEDELTITNVGLILSNPSAVRKYLGN